MVLFFTALSVSIDAYAAGFAYGLTRKLGFFGAIYAGTITFFACLAAGLFRVFFSRGAMLVNFVSGMVLIVLGVKYMVGKCFEKERDNGISFRHDLTALGFFVSVDAAFACLAINENTLVCAFLTSVFHAAFLYFGAMTAKPSRIFGDLTFLSGVFLFLLGIKRSVG